MTKKSKIGLITLTAIPATIIATTGVVALTSCANKEESYSNIIVNEDSVAMIRVLTNGSLVPLNILVKNNVINIELKKEIPMTIELSMFNEINKVINQKDIQNNKLNPNDKIEWSLNGWSNLPGPDLEKSSSFLLDDLNESASYELIGKINNSLKFKIDINVTLIQQ